MLVILLIGSMINEVSCPNGQCPATIRHRSRTSAVVRSSAVVQTSRPVAIVAQAPPTPIEKPKEEVVKVTTVRFSGSAGGHHSTGSVRTRKIEKTRGRSTAACN